MHVVVTDKKSAPIFYHSFESLQSRVNYIRIHSSLIRNQRNKTKTKTMKKYLSAAKLYLIKKFNDMINRNIFKHEPLLKSFSRFNYYKPAASIAGCSKSSRRWLLFCMITLQTTLTMVSLAQLSLKPIQ